MLCDDPRIGPEAAKEYKAITLRSMQIPVTSSGNTPRSCYEYLAQ
jgi:hypothetical protein